MTLAQRTMQAMHSWWVPDRINFMNVRKPCLRETIPGIIAREACRWVALALAGGRHVSQERNHSFITYIHPAEVQQCQTAPEAVCILLWMPNM